MITASATPDVAQQVQTTVEAIVRRGLVGLEYISLEDPQVGSTSLLLIDGDSDIAGYATVDRNDLPWSQHVAELRVLVGPQLRGRGLGRLLTEEAFRIALGMGVDKIIGQMTVDQHTAIGVFRSLGFQPEALLRDHVKDRAGEKHDLVILSHDVEAAQRTMAAVGVLDAVSES